MIFPATMHIGGDLIWNVYYYIKQLNWTERSHIFQISPSAASSESTDSPFSCRCKVKESRRVNPRKDYYPQAKLLETFRFEDEDHCVDEISLESALRSLKKIDTPSFISLFSPEKLTRLFLLKEVKPSSDPKVIRLQTFDNLIISVTMYSIFAKTRSRITTAITFSRQNDVGSRARCAHYLALRESRSRSRPRLRI